LGALAAAAQWNRLAENTVKAFHLKADDRTLTWLALAIIGAAVIALTWFVWSVSPLAVVFLFVGPLVALAVLWAILWLCAGS